MTNYLLNLNTQANGDNEVHRENCSYAPKSNVEDLGFFSSCHPAITKAKQLHPFKTIDGCIHCSTACHNS